MKNLSSKLKKTTGALALSLAMTLGGCKRKGEKSIRNFLRIKNPGETEFIEYKKTLIFDDRDFTEKDFLENYCAVSYDLDTGKRLLLGKEFMKKMESDKNIDALWKIKEYLLNEGYDFSTVPRYGGVREVIFPDYLTRNFTLFGKEYLIFDEKGNLSVEKLLEDLPYRTYSDIKDPVNQMNDKNKKKREYLAFIKTDKEDYYVLREISWSNEPPRVEIDVYKLKNSKVPKYTSKIPMD